MIRLTLPVLVGLLALSAFCIPPHRFELEAMPDNLWTHGGASDSGLCWSHPSDSTQVLKWTRSEYGKPWNFYVIDRGIGHPAWYSRMDYRILVLYMVASASIGGMCGWVLRRRQSRETFPRIAPKLQ